MLSVGCGAPFKLLLFSVSLRSVDCGGAGCCFGVRLEHSVSPMDNRIRCAVATRMGLSHPASVALGGQARTMPLNPREDLTTFPVFILMHLCKPNSVSGNRAFRLPSWSLFEWSSFAFDSCDLRKSFSLAGSRSEKPLIRVLYPQVGPWRGGGLRDCFTPR